MILVSTCSCLCPSHWSQVLSREWRCSWAAPTGGAPTTSEWSTILLPSKVRLILETWRYTKRTLHDDDTYMESHFSILDLREGNPQIISPSKCQVKWIFDYFLPVSPIKRLSNIQPNYRCFKTPWRLCNDWTLFGVHNDIYVILYTARIRPTIRYSQQTPKGEILGGGVALMSWTYDLCTAFALAVLNAISRYLCVFYKDSGMCNTAFKLIFGVGGLKYHTNSILYIQ